MCALRCLRLNFNPPTFIQPTRIHSSWIIEVKVCFIKFAQTKTPLARCPWLVAVLVRRCPTQLLNECLPAHCCHRWRQITAANLHAAMMMCCNHSSLLLVSRVSVVHLRRRHWHHFNTVQRRNLGRFLAVVVVRATVGQLQGTSCAIAADIAALQNRCAVPETPNSRMHDA